MFDLLRLEGLLYVKHWTLLFIRIIRINKK